MHRNQPDQTATQKPASAGFRPIGAADTAKPETAEDITTNTPIIVALDLKALLFNIPDLKTKAQLGIEHIKSTCEVYDSMESPYLIALTLPNGMTDEPFHSIIGSLNECPLQKLTADACYLNDDSLTALIDTLQAMKQPPTEVTLLDATLSDTQHNILTSWSDEKNVTLRLNNPSNTPIKEQTMPPKTPLSQDELNVKFDRINVQKMQARISAVSHDPARRTPSTNRTFTFDNTVDGSRRGLSVDQCQMLMTDVAATTRNNPHRDRYELDLQCAQLGDAHVMAIADVIRANAHVSKLDVSQNNHTIRGALALSRAMQSNDHIHTLSMSGDFLAKACDADRKSFLQGIEDCSALQTWDLSHTVMTEQALQDVLNTLLINGHIQSLDLTGVCIRQYSAFGRAHDKAIDKDTTQALLKTCFEAQDKRFTARVNHIKVDTTDTDRLILVNDVKRQAIKGTALDTPHRQDACAALAPLVTHMPLRVRYDALIQITSWKLAQQDKEKLEQNKVSWTQMASGIHIILLAAGLTRDDWYGVTNPVMDDTQQAEAIHAFCDNVSKSMQQLFDEERSAEKRDPHDNETQLQCAKKRLKDALGIVQHHVGLTNAKGNANLLQPTPAISHQMLDQLCRWIMHMGAEKEGSDEKQFVKAEHTNLAMAVIAVIGENADEAKQQLTSQLNQNPQTPADYWYPVSRENDLRDLQKAYLNTLSFSAYTASKSPMLTPARKQVLMIALVMLACAAIFAAFYFTAPLIFTASVITHTAWLGAAGTTGQASLCTGAVMLSMALVAGFRAMRQAHQQKAQRKAFKQTTADAHSMANLPTSNTWQHTQTAADNHAIDATPRFITLPDATRQCMHTFFGGHSMAQNPYVSPKHPVMGDQRHLFFLPEDMMVAADASTTPDHQQKVPAPESTNTATNSCA